jgi:hypothetical protein
MAYLVITIHTRISAKYYKELIIKRNTSEARFLASIRTYNIHINFVVEKTERKKTFGLLRCDCGGIIEIQQTTTF